MISQSVEYALRAVVALAYQEGSPLTGQQIAKMTRVPAPYLLKLMQQLVRGGLVRSQRGRGGGFVLTRSPDEITIWDVVEAVDVLQRIRSCPLGIQGHDSLCALHQRLDRAIEQVETAFRESTLAEVLAENRQSRPLCGQVQTLRPLDLSSPKMPTSKQATLKTKTKSAARPKRNRKKSR